jgi:hypothetical protein
MSCLLTQPRRNIGKDTMSESYIGRYMDRRGRGGALVVRRDAAINRNGGSRCQSLRRSDHLGQHTQKRLPQSRRRWQWPILLGRIKPIRARSSRVIAMLQSPASTGPIPSVTANQLTRALGEAVIRIQSNLPQAVQLHLFQEAY